MTRAWAPLLSVALTILLLSVSFSAIAANDMQVAEEIEEDVPSFNISSETHFIKNMGQWDEEFEFIGTTEFGAIGLAENGIYFDVNIEEDLGQIVKYSFIGGDPENIMGSDRLSSISNFYLGNDPAKWRRSVPSFGTVNYIDLWDGIDLGYTAMEELKYEFILEPYSDPKDIQIKIEGANDIIIDDTELRIKLDNGAVLKDSCLSVFYTDGNMEGINARFLEVDDNIFGFYLDNYDRSRPVVIDPFILTSTFIGASSNERGGNFVQDNSGNYYSAGTTGSIAFPTTAGVYSTTSSGWDDIVVFKMDSTMSTLNYSTYLGGSGNEQVGPIGLGPKGSIFVGGLTFSNDFPTTSGAYDTTYQPSGTIFGETDAWIVRFDDNCTELGFGTYLGVKMNETISHLYVDGSRNAVVVGSCESSDFPVTNDAYDSSHNGGIDIFVTKLKASGDELLHSTFIGGNNYDSIHGIDHISDDVLIMTGMTRSNNFPSTSGAYDTTFNGGSAGFNSIVLKYNISSATLDLSTFVGISYGNDLEMDDTGNIYVVGMTTDSNHPTTPGAYDTTKDSQEDGIYFKLNPSMSQLLYSTFIGGDGWDSMQSIDLNSTGSPFMIGRSRSTDYPTTKDCDEDTLGGGWDIVVTRMDPQGTRLIYSTYMGDSNDDYASRIVTDGEDTAIIGGYTRSSNFPTTAGTYDPTHNGGYDLFFSKIDLTLVLVTPEKPENLTGIMTDDKVNLQWEPPVDDGGTDILYYTIYRGTVPTSMKKIDTTTDLQYEDTGLDLRETYYYTVSANNSIGESLKPIAVSFWETVPPTFNGDLTPTDPLPGMEITLTADYTDNVEVDSVNVEYWTTGMRHVNESMVNETGDAIWTHTISLQDINTDLFYRFSAVDIKGNRMGTENFTREIRGEVYPVLWNDQTPNIASPSTEFTFSINARDNHKLDQVKVEFWVDEGTQSSNFMEQVEETDTYTFTTMVPNVADQNLNYFFSARDNGLKWNSTMAKSIPIIDNIQPIFLVDKSATEGSTGETFSFLISVKDNLHLSEVSAEYWFDKGSTIIEPMVKGAGNQWRGTIDIPTTAVFMYYRFKAMDPMGNMNRTMIKQVNITDTLLPKFLDDSSDKAAYTGSVFTFKVSVYDNIGVIHVGVFLYYQSESAGDLDLNRSGDVFTGSFRVPVDVKGPMSYEFIASDIANGHFHSDMTEVEVIDIIPPTIKEIDDVAIYLGATLSITANATDNIGVKTISWNGGPISSNNLNLEGGMVTPGIYDITVIATDPSGNTASTSFVLTVIPMDLDTDMDGIPDGAEMVLGLDKDDHFDGYGDLDSDGLANWLEYVLGLDLEEADTDGDGMPDKWEYENGLRPFIPSEFDDADHDGISDLEEYQQGTDPRVSDAVDIKTEKYDATLLIIILILLIIVLLAIWGFVGFRFLSGRKQELPPLPEPDTEDEELEKMLHDLPNDGIGMPMEPQLNTYDFEPTSQDQSQVSDLFADEEIPQQEPPIPEEETAADQIGEEEPFAEQPIETLQAGEVIQ